jgi:hypothetical protein
MARIIQQVPKATKNRLLTTLYHQKIQELLAGRNDRKVC